MEINEIQIGISDHCCHIITVSILIVIRRRPKMKKWKQKASLRAVKYLLWPEKKTINCIAFKCMLERFALTSVKSRFTVIFMSINVRFSFRFIDDHNINWKLTVQKTTANTNTPFDMCKSAHLLWSNRIVREITFGKIKHCKLIKYSFTVCTNKIHGKSTKLFQFAIFYSEIESSNEIEAYNLWLKSWALVCFD